MATLSSGKRTCWRRLRPVLRAFMSVVLVLFLGTAILPWGLAECVPGVPGGSLERTFCIEPLDVCDHGDSFVGVLFDFPVLLPGAPRLVPPPKGLPCLQQAAAVVPDGFHPAIEHPPRLPA
jgi:hypothetical protein